MPMMAFYKSINYYTESQLNTFMLYNMLLKFRRILQFLFWYFLKAQLHLPISNS